MSTPFTGWESTTVTRPSRCVVRSVTYQVPRPTALLLFHVDQCMPCTHEDGPQVIWKRDDRSIQQTTILPSCMPGSTTTVCRVGTELLFTAAGRTLADAGTVPRLPSPAASASPAAPAVILMLVFMIPPN